jgi:GNAT superfamily N-acetyltransferase
MPAASSLRIVPLTPGRWADFDRLFGPNGACGGCWCMWWRLRRKDFEAAAGDGNRRAFQAIVEAGPPPGLIAYAGGEPVGWCQLTPRDHLPVLDRSPNLKRVDDRPVWSLSCFFVKAGHRRQGVTAALIEAAKDHARRAGASVLEAYPWDTGEKKSSTTIFTGRASTFYRLGFQDAARRASHRPMVRCVLGEHAG